MPLRASLPLPDRLRGGDASALLELAHATHARALAVARASAWSEDPEALLLDAYVALWLRRAAAPAAGVEAWALAEVLAYCARRTERRKRALGRRARGVWKAVRRIGHAMAAAARAAGALVHHAGPSPVGRSRAAS